MLTFCSRSPKLHPTHPESDPWSSQSQRMHDCMLLTLHKSRSWVEHLGDQFEYRKYDQNSKAWLRLIDGLASKVLSAYNIISYVRSNALQCIEIGPGDLGVSVLCYVYANNPRWETLISKMKEYAFCTGSTDLLNFSFSINCSDDPDSPKNSKNSQTHYETVLNYWFRLATSRSLSADRSKWSKIKD